MQSTELTQSTVLNRSRDEAGRECLWLASRRDDNYWYCSRLSQSPMWKTFRVEPSDFCFMISSLSLTHFGLLMSKLDDQWTAESLKPDVSKVGCEEGDCEACGGRISSGGCVNHQMVRSNARRASCIRRSRCRRFNRGLPHAKTLHDIHKDVTKKPSNQKT